MSRLDEVASREWTAGHRLSLRIISAYQLKKRNLVAAYNITTLRMVFVDQEGSNGSLQWNRRSCGLNFYENLGCAKPDKLDKPLDPASFRTRHG